jgi:branched-chain amino acid transport system substrate-binding protein
VLAAKINAEGGVDGRKIELHVFDDTTNPTESARGATQLIQQNKVVAIIGATTGSGTLAAGPVAMRYEVPILAPNGTIAVTEKKNKFFPWVFRTMPSDLNNTEAMLDRAIAKGAKKVGIFYQEDAYGKNTADYLVELARKKNVEIVGVAAAPMKATDVSAQVIRLRNGNPDAVLIQASAPALGAAFARAARQTDLKAAVWAPMGLGQKALIDGSGVAGDGMRLPVIVNWDQPTTKQEELRKLLVAAGKTPQGFGELLSTNGLLAITEAVKTIKGDATGKNIRDALEKLCGLKTYMEGSACYSADNHDGWTPDILTTVIIKSGKFVNEK